MDEILLAIQQLIKSAVQTTGSEISDIKEVIYGDPLKIPVSSLPAITITPSRSAYLQRGSRYDEKTHTVSIHLVYNARDFFEKDSETDKNDLVFVDQDAVKKMESVVAGSQATSRTSIAGVIASNTKLPLTVDGVTRNTATNCKVIDIDYVRLSKARGFNTYEVVLTAEVTAIGDR